MNKHYIEDENHNLKKVSLLEWAKWFNNADRRVAFDQLLDCQISTVFLGFDHNYDPAGESLLYETMIFGGEHSQEMWRYSTREQALAGHENAVKYVKEARNVDT